MVFCNVKTPLGIVHKKVVTILILIDGFLQLKVETIDYIDGRGVTILILIDGFLQYVVVTVQIVLTASQSLF